MRIAVTSGSLVKHQAIFQVFGSVSLLPVLADVEENPEQPYGTVNRTRASVICAQNRTKKCLNSKTYADCTLIISIENGIIDRDNVYYDVCDIDIYDVSRNIFISSSSFKEHILIPINSKYMKNVFASGEKNELGYNKTAGSFIASEISKYDSAIKSNNWMEHFGVNRVTQIKKTLEWCKFQLDNDMSSIVERMRIIPNFPSEGVNFQDLFSLFDNVTTMNTIVSSLVDHVSKYNIGKIAGLESRGFIIGILLSYTMQIPFVPVRKAGKLPPPVVREKYEKEYGQDEMEMWEGAIQKGDVVLPVDDILATGGTMKAAINIIEKLGGTVPCFVVLNDVPPLRERAQEKLVDYEPIILLKN